MADVYFFSGPCGCGKTMLTEAFANHLGKPIYLIHGDDFQAGFITPEHTDGPTWPEILRFNWDCILSVAGKALAMGVDVVIDYIVEDELPLVQQLAADFSASLHYIVLTASEDTLRQRLQARGDAWLTDRAIFLKHKLDSMPENQGKLLDVTDLTIEQVLALLPFNQ